MLYQDLIEQLDEALAQLIWDQWFEIGGSGSKRKGEIPFIVDIEALVLGSTRFGVKDPRIIEQCIDWLALNGRLVNLQRLKNIQQSCEFGDNGGLGRLADFMISEKHQNWKSIRKSFPSSTNKVAESSGHYHARGMSMPPIPMKSQNLIFRLRNFFGLSARADVFCWLLTHEEGHASQIAKETHWMPKTVQLILIELEQSRLISRVTKGRQKRYRLDPADWSIFAPAKDRAIWFDLSRFYGGCFEVFSLLDKLVRLEGKNSALQSMEIGKAMPTLATTFFGLTPGASFQLWERETRGEALVTYFQQECVTLSKSVIDDRLFYRTSSFPRSQQIEMQQ